MPYTTLKYTYPSLIDKSVENINKSFLSSDTPSYDIYENVVVYNARVIDGCALGGVELNNGEIAPGTGMNLYMEGLWSPPPIDTCTVSEDVVYLGYLHPCYGHNITDCIKQAWFFDSEEYNIKYKNWKIVYTSIEPVKKWQK